MVGRLLLPSHHSIILASLTPLSAEISILKKENWEMKYRIFFVEKEKQWVFEKKCTGGDATGIMCIKVYNVTGLLHPLLSLFNPSSGALNSL